MARRELTTNGLAEVSSGTAFPFGEYGIPTNLSRSERRKREAHEPFERPPNLPRIARRVSWGFVECVSWEGVAKSGPLPFPGDAGRFASCPILPSNRSLAP